MWKYLFVFILINFTQEILSLPAFEKRGVVDILSNIFRGKGTFFHPVTEGGAIGSCGPVANDHSRICAMVIFINFIIFYLVNHPKFRILNNMDKHQKRVHGVIYNYV